MTSFFVASGYLGKYSTKKLGKSASESFWHAKNNLVSRHQQVGLGQPPPPVWEFFPHNPVFFSDSDPKGLDGLDGLFQVMKI